MISPRGPLATRRMTAHWVVLTAAALTTLVTAAVAAALTVFTGQALPRAVQHDLVTAPDTGMSVTALVNGPAPAAQGSAALRSRIAAAIPGVPFSFDEAFWSDPLGLIPGALPASPASAGKGNTALIQAASMSDVTSHAVLIAGRWPADPGGDGAAIPAALPASAAALLHVSAGDVLRLRDSITHTALSFDITGVFAPLQGTGRTSSYWNLSYIPASGVSSSGAGSATYGPLLVSQAAFKSALAMNSGSWVAQPDMAAVPDADLNALSASVTSLSKSLLNSSFLGGAQLVTSLPSTLSATAANLDVARSLLVISALELLVLALAALLAVARLLATQREEETALLISRGATRGQLTRLTAAEVVPLSLLASAAGGLAGIRLAGLPASAGPLGTAGIRLADQAGTWLDALGAALVVAAIAVAALLAPVATPSPAAARVRRGRQAMVAGVARAGLDIALLALAVLAGWQLRQYSALTGGGTAGIDPVLALAPALALAAGSTATLRLLPLAARATGRLGARGKGLTTSLASWRFSRMPVRQGGAALLLVLAVATGTLALAQHASWTRSAWDQADFAAGGDVQVNPPAPVAPGAVGAVTAVPGVTRSMAVATDIQASPGEVVAIDPTQAAQVVKLRADESPLPPDSLFRAITPSGDPRGTVLSAPQPGARPGTIALTATLGSAAGSSGGLAGQLGPVTVTLTILDRSGASYQVVAGSLVADGRPHVLAASLGGTTARYPLRVAAITATYLMPPDANAPLALTVTGLSLGGWTDDASSPGADSMDLSNKSAAPDSGPAHVTSRAATFDFDSGYGTVPAETGSAQQSAQQVSGQLVLLPAAAKVTAIPAVPAIATKAFADANSVTAGSVVPASLDGVQVPMRIVAVVTSFPTVTAPGGALITDLGGLEEYLARQSGVALPVTAWWLATAGGGVPPALAASVPAGTNVVSASGLATATTDQALSAAPQLALLAMALAAAFLAVTGFWVSIAADVRQRRGETALLAALGVTRRGAAAQLVLEKLLVSVPSATIGVLLGLIVARLLVPAVTLTPAAGQPVPPAIPLYDLPLVIPLAVAVAVLPAVAAALAAARRLDPAAALRAAEAA